MEEKEHPLWENIVKQAEKGISTPEEFAKAIPSEHRRNLLCFHMLTGRMRKYVIEKVKDPLRKALITGKSLTKIIKTIKLVMGRLPPLTVGNARSKKTYNLMLMENLFFTYEKNPGREDMFRAVLKLLKIEIDHDGYYEARYDWWLEQHIKMILTGQWLPRIKDCPDICWLEPKPYGGQHTITHAIQKNRKKIIDLLGEEWQWLKEGKYPE